MSSLTGLRWHLLFTLALVVALFIIPPAAGPIWITFVSYSLVIAIACLGLNLLVGNMGLLSLGHAAYFGIGAYTIALTMFWYDFREIAILLPAGVGAASLVSFIVGYIASKLNKIYFSIFTLAIAQVVWSLLVRNFNITGGASGVYVKKPIILGYDTIAITRIDFLFQFYYYFIVVLFLFTLTTCWIILKSPFGLVMKSIKLNPERTEFIGINVRRHKWVIFTVSGFFCGLSGGVFAILNGAIHPGFSDWLYSLRILIPIILGGQDYLIGPVVGIFIFNIIEMISLNTLLTWKIMTGAMLIIISIRVPRGITGIIHDLYTRLSYVVKD